MIKHIAILAAALVLSSAHAITIDDVLTQVKQNNTQLKAAGARLDADQKSLKSSNNLPDPEVGGAYLFGKGPLDDKWEIGISQQVEWPGVYSARSNAADAFISALQHGYSAEQLEVLAQARSLCIDIVGYNNLIQFNQGVLNNLNRLFDTYNKALAHGEVSIIDVNKLKIERLLMQQKIDEATSLRTAAVEQLKGINGGIDIAGAESINTYAPLPLLSLEQHLTQARSSSPLLAKQNALVTAQSKNATATARQALPSLSLGYRHVCEMGDHFNGISMGVSLPVFSNRGKKSAARASVFAAEIDASFTQNTIESNIITCHQRATALKNQIGVYDNALTSTDNIAVLNKALNGGEMSLLNYLQELRYFVEAQAVMLSLQNDYNKTLAQLWQYTMP